MMFRPIKSKTEMIRRNMLRIKLSVSHRIMLLFVLLAGQALYGQTKTKSDVLIKFEDDHGSGYKNRKGETVIPAGKYSMCFTDTFRTYAIVYIDEFGFAGINRKEEILYKVFMYDNGPDYPSEGLFRIIKDGKIGYANEKTGTVVIEPRFKCAQPFSEGTAKVSEDCQHKKVGEHTIWNSNKWYFIDQSGQRVDRKE